MRFRAPKIHTEQKRWSVILNPLKSELDKKRVSEKISQIFGVSFEEARELTQSTPIILIDEIAHGTALQVQNVFQETRADITLTDDAFAKRRCYRAVWPDPPKLSLLAPLSEETVPQKVKIEEVPAETAVKAVLTPVIEERMETPAPPPPAQDFEKKYRDLEVLYEEKSRENEELKQNIQQEVKNQSSKSTAELKSALEEWEERYQSLKEEYQESRSIYEEKIRAREKEFEALKAQLKELPALQEKAARLEKENQEFLKAQGLYQEKLHKLKELPTWQEKAARLEKESHELQNAQVLFQEKINAREKELGVLRLELKGLESLRNKVIQLEKQNQELAETQVSSEEKFRAREEELETLQNRLQDLEALQEKTERLQKESAGLQDKLNRFESVKEALEQALHERTEEATLWRQKYEGLAERLVRVETLYEEEKKLRAEAEESSRQASELVEQTRREIAAQVTEAEHWHNKFQVLEEAQKRIEREFFQFSQEKETEVKQLQELNQELERELEGARKQARDLIFRMEQQEMIEKKNRLTGEITGKENRARELRTELERLRREIHDRELQAQTLANEQGNLEREILEARQTQRHLLEQNKMKEKQIKLKRPLTLDKDFPTPEVLE